MLQTWKRRWRQFRCNHHMHYQTVREHVRTTYCGDVVERDVYVATCCRCEASWSCVPALVQYYTNGVRHSGLVTARG